MAHTPSFAEVRYPSDLSFGSTFGPCFQTDVVTLLEGGEQRNMAWLWDRPRGDLRYGIKSLAALQRVLAFFQARRGRAQAFRLKWHLDWQATNQLLAIGDGSSTEWAFVKWYLNGLADDTYTRRIFKLVGVGYPVGNPYDSVQVFLDGTLQTSGYSVDYVNGLVTFSAAPAAGVQVSASFEYDFPVRFDTDTLGESLRLVKGLQGRQRQRLGDPQYWTLVDQYGQLWYYWWDIAGQIAVAATAPPAPFTEYRAAPPPGMPSAPSYPLAWMGVSDELGTTWYVWPDRTGALQTSTSAPPGSGLSYNGPAPTPHAGPTYLAENTFDTYTLVADSAGEPLGLPHIQAEIAATFDALGDVEPIPIIGERL